MKKTQPTHHMPSYYTRNSDLKKMEYNERMNDATFSPSLCPSSSTNTSSPATQVVASPCAACKVLRRRCAEKCVLAPYFPPTQPLKFTIAHKVFGASSIIKLLQELPESHREDAVNSLVYEANARIRDPVYGCAGTISHLQEQISELKAQLAKAQAEVLHLQSQNSNLLSIDCMGMSSSHQETITIPSDDHFETYETNNLYSNFYFEDQL